MILRKWMFTSQGTPEFKKTKCVLFEIRVSRYGQTSAGIDHNENPRFEAGWLNVLSLSHRLNHLRQDAHRSHRLLIYFPAPRFY